MASKKFIRLNVNDNYLSLGNFIRVAKSYSKNPNSFYQSEIFCAIFNTNSVADSTVNNYCTGFRKINSTYQNYYICLKEKYEKDTTAMIPTIENILNLLYGATTHTSFNNLYAINKDTILKSICDKLYIIGKNDMEVPTKFTEKLYGYLNDNNLYEFVCSVLFFVILDRNQPILLDDTITNAIQKNIYNTNISTNNIEEYINIQLNSGIWSIRAILELAKKNNPFACFEIASLEFYGIISGQPRYEKAYDYYKTASLYGHPTADWAIGFLYYNGYIGNKSRHDLYLAFKYFNKARKHKCSNAFNSLGLMFLNGDTPHIKKNEKIAIHYFEKSILLGNVYGYNNLGKIYETKKDYKKAFEYFSTSANIGDSYGANKLGEFYRRGLGRKKDLKKAYEYYLKSSECCKFTLCSFSKYNLAVYFYKCGVPELGIAKDIDKAILLLEDVANSLTCAKEELVYLYYEKYLNSNKDNYLLCKVKENILKLECSKDYNSTIQKRVSSKLKNICTDKIVLP